MKFGEEPSIIRDTEFDDNGFARVGDDLLVPAYVASQSGFHCWGRDSLGEFYDRLRNEAGILPLCPFEACKEYLDFSKLPGLGADERLSLLNPFNDNIGRVNYGMLMSKSKLMIAILDGGHAVDDGVAAEIGFFAARYDGLRPIFGIRSDVRGAEPGASINLAVRFFLDKGPYHGFFFGGDDPRDDAITALGVYCKNIKSVV